MAVLVVGGRSTALARTLSVTVSDGAALAQHDSIVATTVRASGSGRGGQGREEAKKRRDGRDRPQKQIQLGGEEEAGHLPAAWMTVKASPVTATVRNSTGL